MQPVFNADFWTSLGLFAFVVGAPIAAITTIVVMWTDVTNRARSLRTGGAPQDTIRSVCAGESGEQIAG